METLTASMTPRVYRIEKVRKETYDTFSLEFDRPPGPSGSEFRPGQFNMLYLFGTGEIPISISGDPGRQGRIVHTTRAVGTVTGALRACKKGDSIGVRGPFGRGWPVDRIEGKDVVLIAGGIGLAPLRPVVYSLLAKRGQFGKLVLLYGARTPEEILYAAELKKWSSRFDMEVHVSVDRATRAWKGNVGVVTGLIRRAPFEAAKTAAMICGPEIMMRFTIDELLRSGVDASSIYLSMERNMKCAVGFCGHCQFGPHFICKDGPVFAFPEVRSIFGVREI